LNRIFKKNLQAKNLKIHEYIKCQALYFESMNTAKENFNSDNVRFILECICTVIESMVRKEPITRIPIEEIVDIFDRLNKICESSKNYEISEADRKYLI